MADPITNGTTLVQLVNTLDHGDGGPARNAFELNLALNAQPDVHASLFWMTGDDESAVSRTFAEAGGVLPPTPPAPVHLSARPRNGSVTVAHVLSQVRRADALILHGYFLWWVPCFAAAGALLGTRIFVMPHGALTRYERSKKSAKKRLFHLAAGWWLNRIIYGFVTGSEAEREELLADGIGRHVFYAGVGTTPPTDIRPRPLSSPVRLLTMSRVAAKKRIDIAVAAVRLLRDQGRDVHLTIAGAGDDQATAELKSVIEKNGVADEVSMVGLVTGTAKSDLLAKSDLFLLPSEDENFGIGVAEASAHGLFVIASVKVAAAMMLSDTSATKVAAISPQTFAQEIGRVIDEYSGDARVQIANEASDTFSWSAVAQRWLWVVRRQPAQR